MSRDDLVPKGEALRSAIRWIGQHGRHDARFIQQTSERFDLSPLEEEFLLRYFRSRSDADTNAR